MSKSSYVGPIIAVSIVIAFAGWMLSGDSESAIAEETNTKQTKSLIPGVQIVTSEARNVKQQLTINGVIEANRSVTVRSETSGKIITLLKKRGDLVKTGDIIAKVDQQDIPALIKQANAFENKARLEYEGILKLNEQGLQNEAQLASAAASYEQSKAQLVTLKLQLKQKSIRAPFSGQIDSDYIELGSYVRVGDVVTDINDYSKVKFVGSVSEKDILSINLGQAGNVELINGEVVQAKVSYISSITNPATRTFTVEMTVSNVSRNVSGVTSIANINLKDTSGHYISPALLFVDNAGIMGLKTLDENDNVVFSNVEIIRSDTNGVWISGLSSNADIIIVGQGFVNVGDQTNPTRVEFDSNVAVGL